MAFRFITAFTMVYVAKKAESEGTIKRKLFETMWSHFSLSDIACSIILFVLVLYVNYFLCYG